MDEVAGDARSVFFGMSVSGPLFKGRVDNAAWGWLKSQRRVKQPDSGADRTSRSAPVRFARATTLVAIALQ